MIQDIICQTEKIISPSGVPILRREYIFSAADANSPDSTGSAPTANVAATSGSSTPPDSAHRTIDEIRIYSLLEEIIGMSDSSCASASSSTPANPKIFNKDYAFSRTGWQSWDAGWETMADERTPRYIPFLIPALKKYIEVPESSYKKDKEYGQFIIWLRWNNFYLVAASTGNAPRSSATPAGNDTTSDSTALPPVQY